MTKDEALRLALEALEKMQNAIYNIGGEHVIDLNFAIEQADVSEDAITVIKAALEAKDEPVANNWSVFNTGAEVWDKLSLADAVVELTPSRLERGWSAVCVINKDNPPLYATPPQQEEKEAPVLRKKPYLDKGADYEHGFIDGMQYQMQSSVDKAVNAMSQRKPLTDDEITLIIADCASSHQHTDIHLARAIEAAHGIKGEA